MDELSIYDEWKYALRDERKEFEMKKGVAYQKVDSLRQSQEKNETVLMICHILRVVKEQGMKIGSRLMTTTVRHVFNWVGHDR